jgi:membrane-bound serine protease (ClpP class)
MDLVVYRVSNRETNDETYMSDEELEAAEHPDQWEKLNPVLESREEKFLVVNGVRAVELKLAQPTVTSQAELRDRYQLESDFIVMQHRAVDTAVQVLNSPFVTGLLFVVGLVALYIELSAPGISVGGLISGLCFALFFWSRALGGTSGWLEVILFLAGVVFIAMEFFVIPGFGVAGILGFLLVFASLVMASQDFAHWNSARQLPSLATTLAVIFASGIISVAAISLLSRYMGSLPVLNRLVLHPPRAEEDDDEAPVSKDSPQPADGRFPVAIGDWGIADSPLRPAGKAKFGNDYVDVVTEGVFVDVGQRVRVIDISGNRVMVRRVESPENA